MTGKDRKNLSVIILGIAILLLITIIGSRSAPQKNGVRTAASEITTVPEIERSLINAGCNIFSDSPEFILAECSVAADICPDDQNPEIIISAVQTGELVECFSIPSNLENIDENIDYSQPTKTTDLSVYCANNLKDNGVLMDNLSVIDAYFDDIANTAICFIESTALNGQSLNQDNSLGITDDDIARFKDKIRRLNVSPQNIFGVPGSETVEFGDVSF